MSQISTTILPTEEPKPAAPQVEVPAKFKNPDGSVNVAALAQSYGELEKKASAPVAPVVKVTGDELDAAFTSAATPQVDLWGTAQSELANEGAVSATTRAALKTAHKVTDAVIDGMVAGAKAQSALVGAKLSEVAGGVENLNAAIAHATATRNPQQLQELRSALKSNLGPMVLRGLMAEMGTKTVQNQGQSGPASMNDVTTGVSSMNSTAPFTDAREYLSAFQDPRYYNDPVYREAVVRRAAATQTVKDTTKKK